MASKKILFVEDDEIIIRIYRSKFQAEGYHVEVATDGESALQFLKKSIPDLVVLDLQLPKVNGIEVLKFIRSQPAMKSLPVVVFSNAYISTMIDEAWKAGASQCLIKAKCTPPQLLQVLSSFVTNESVAPVGSPTRPTLPKSEAPSSSDPSYVIPSGNALAKLAQEARAWTASVSPTVNPTLSAPNARRTTKGTTAGPGRSLNPADAEAQSVIREMFLNACPHTMTALRAQLLNLTHTDEVVIYRQGLKEMFVGLHSLTGNAGLAGFERIAEFSSALEALIQGLQEAQKDKHISALRTLGLGVDSLNRLIEDALDHGALHGRTPLALVIHSDEVCARAICTALDESNVRSLSVDDRQSAMRLVNRNKFDLIFLDGEASKANGVEFSTELRNIAPNRATPVVLMTTAEDFANRLGSATSDGYDLITKPLMLIEVTVKALTHMVNLRDQQQGLARAA